MPKPTLTIEPEEILPDAQHVWAGLPLPGLGLIERALGRRTFWIAWALAVGFIVWWGGAFSLKVIGGRTQALRAAEENRFRTFSYGGARGAILDRYGAVLALNAPRFSLVVFPRQLPTETGEYRELWERAAGILGGPPELFEHLGRVARAGPEPFRLPFTLTLEQAGRFRPAGGREDFPGMVLIEERERSYPGDEALSHVVGYSAGGHLSGVEAFSDAALTGIDGTWRWVEDARGMSQGLVEVKNPQEGASIMLTLDAAFQQASFEILDRHLKALKLTRAAFVALDPANGDILALVSAPAYSPNKLIEGLTPEEFAALEADPSRPFFNRAVAGLYPPGSTIKPFLAAAALQERVIDPAKTIFVTGAIEIAHPNDPAIRYTFRDWRPHGAVDMIRAIAVSSNVYFYTVGGGYGGQEGLGIERIGKYLERFGFGERAFTGVPGAVGGRVPTPAWKKRVKGEPWYIGDTYNVAIGQGDVLVTPLQLASATAALANRGTLWQPRLVKAVARSGAADDKRSEEDEVVRADTRETIPAAAIHKEVLPPAVFSIPRQGMREAVTSGSARALADLPQAVAGKTGTAQTGRDAAHAWFTGFAPYEEPRIALTVVVEDGGEGSAAAVPIAKEILGWWMENRLK